jgi:hypothetical protein
MIDVEDRLFDFIKADVEQLVRSGIFSETNGLCVAAAEPPLPSTDDDSRRVVLDKLQRAATRRAGAA